MIVTMHEMCTYIYPLPYVIFFVDSFFHSFVRSFICSSDLQHLNIDTSILFVLQKFLLPFCS